MWPRRHYRGGDRDPLGPSFFCCLDRTAFIVPAIRGVKSVLTATHSPFKGSSPEGRPAGTAFLMTRS
jgi:hypothetical protein